MESEVIAKPYEFSVTLPRGGDSLMSIVIYAEGSPMLQNEPSFVVGDKARVIETLKEILRKVESSGN